MSVSYPAQYSILIPFTDDRGWVADDIVNEDLYDSMDTDPDEDSLPDNSINALRKVFTHSYNATHELDEAISHGNGCLTGDDFEINSDEYLIKIGPGNCLVGGGGVSFEVSGDTYLNVMNPGHYAENHGPTTTGTQYVWIVAEYHPSLDAEDNFALDTEKLSFQLILDDNSAADFDEGHMIRLGFATVSFPTSIFFGATVLETASRLSELTGDSGDFEISRDYVPGFMDGGWVGDPSSNYLGLIDA